jgi:uncharacterized membrane protein YeaQ/YmgE (transglycosylase-associated protein family)
VLAFLVAGVILGVLARVLRHGPDDSPLVATLLVGVVGAVVGGCGMNLVLSDGLVELTAWSFTMACVLAMVALGLLEGGVGRHRTDG